MTRTKPGQAGAFLPCHRGMCCGWDADSATGRQSRITLLGLYWPGACSSAPHVTPYGILLMALFCDNCGWLLRQRFSTSGCAEAWSKSETSPAVRRASRVAVSEALCSADSTRELFWKLSMTYEQVKNDKNSGCDEYGQFYYIDFDAVTVL